MAESLQFSIGADTKAFQDGIGGMLAGVASLAAAFIGLQAIVNSFSDAIELGGRLHDLSTRTGETAGNLSILERAFQNTGLEAERVGPAINKMQKSIIDASDSGSAAAKAFASLGLSLTELQGLQPIQQMEKIAQALSNIPDPAQRAQLAIAIFGKAGGDLLPILRNFSDEIAQARNQLGSLPDIMSDSASGFDGVGDSLSAIRNKLTELSVGFLSTLLPAIEKVLASLSRFDAAGFGQGLSEFLMGAFQNPLKVIELWANSMRFAAQSMGNELISAFDYASQFLSAMFGAAGGSMEEIMKPFQIFVSVVAPGVASVFEKAMSVVRDSADNVSNRFAEAASHATFVRKDYLGAEDSAERIKTLTAEIREDGRQFAASFEESHQTSKEMLAEIANFEPVTAQDRFPTIANDATGLRIPFPTIANDATGLPTLPVNRLGVVGGGMSAAQIQADIGRRLSLIAGSTSTQAIGQSISAQRAQELQKQLDTMAALGKQDTAEFQSMQRSLQTNLDIAFGNQLSASDKDRASQWARENLNNENLKGLNMTFTDLEKLARENILEQKRANDPDAIKEQRRKAEEAGAGGGAPKQQPLSMMSLVQQLIAIVTKIEPKIPQHVMT